MNTESARGLDSLALYEHAVVESLRPGNGLTRRLMDVGFVPGAAVECVLRGSMSAYRIRGATLALRPADAAGIRVRP